MNTRMFPAAALCLVASGFGVVAASQPAVGVPAGFTDTAVFAGLTQPTVVRFAPNGEVLVAEKSGLVKRFDDLSDTTPTVVADLRADVYNFWDRGLLGLALSPGYATDGTIYALYTRDALPGGSSPHWQTGDPLTSGDPCPATPGATADGCVATGRLLRLDIGTGTLPKTAADGTPLITDWCQQYPSHSVGSLQFGADGFLYASGGDGANFNVADYGQYGSPLNPCGDPSGPPGTVLTPPSAEGGALRSQDVRTNGDPLGLDGTVIRIDPVTGAGAPGNPLAGSADANARRVVAHGMRNPFRIAFRPGTSDLYVGDVGWGTWEEINRIPSPADDAVDNLGWPCYEGSPRQSGFDNLDLAVCENLYLEGAGAVTAPTLAYQHTDQVALGDGCPTGSSSISGLAFYQGGSYPAQYDGALFFTDYTRRCLWSMRPNAQGVPDPSTLAFFSALPGGAVNLEIGPAGDLFYADFDNGTIRRIAYSMANQPPTAQLTANPTSGNEPLTVAFSASGSSDPEGDPLTGAWDLDDDGAFDDATGLTASRTFTTTGPKRVTVMVTDPGGLTSTASTVVEVGVAPVATITSPTATTSWKVGDSIAVSGSATDGGTPLPGTALTWDVDIHHCSAPDVCHVHPITSFTGQTGTIDAPDHDYPSYITVRLTATDSSGLTDVKTVRIDPRTVNLTFATNPPGLVVSVGGSTQTAPFAKEAIVGATYSISTAASQQLGATSYAFAGWSDGGAHSHTITVPASDTTYTASFTQVASSSLVGAWGFEEGAGDTTADASGTGNNGTISGASWTTAGKYGRALSFDGVNDLVTVADSASLDLTDAYTLEAWVRPTSAGDGWHSVLMKETPSSLAYGLYSGGIPNHPSSWVTINGADVVVEGTGALPVDAWTHLATTYDGTTLRLYVNGTEAASRVASGAAPVSGSPLRIGGNTIWSEWFAGQVDDVRIYDRVLTASQIAADRDTPVAGAQPDTAAPTAPQGLTATGGVGTAALSWTASLDDVAVAGYRVHRSATSGFTPQPGNQVATTPTTGYDDTVAAGTWYYKVVAYDAAGNLSPPSAQATAIVGEETTPDTIPPTVIVPTEEPPATPPTLTADVTMAPAAPSALRRHVTLTVTYGGTVAPPYAPKGVSVSCLADAKPVGCFADGTLSLLRVPGRHVLTTTVRSPDGQTVTRTVEWHVATPATRLIVKAPPTAEPGKRITVRVSGLLPHEHYLVRLGSRKVAKGKATDDGTAAARPRISSHARFGEVELRVTGTTAERKGHDTTRVVRRSRLPHVDARLGVIHG